jgi:hypothetical protein
VSDPGAPRAGATPASPRPGERGQAQLELLAGVPVLLAAGLIALQLLAAGLSQSLADGAAEAGALAVAAGREPEQAVREALPGWAERRVEVRTDAGLVAVELVPPAIPGLERHLAVGSQAWARPPAP